MHSGRSGGVVNSLDFYPASTSVPWLILLPVRTFFTMEGGDNKFAKFTVPTLKGFLKVPIQNVSGNKQELVARARGWQKQKQKQNP